MIYLGIDTSNYKTSMAVVNQDGSIISNLSEYLDVGLGERGLRQSDAFYKHSCKLPDMFAILSETIDLSDVTAIGVSERPRREEGSYMPCFNAGINLAKVLSCSLKIPVYGFSHQEGHAAAVIEHGNSKLPDSPLILMHLSGGTSEMLSCKISDFGYDTQILGGTLDISFGQLLDRFGVELGLPFPSGMYIDRMASCYDGRMLPGVMPGIRILDAYFNLSGPETRLMNYASEYNIEHGDLRINQDGAVIASPDLHAVCYEIFDRIAEIISKTAVTLCNIYHIDEVYITGGVASSDLLRVLVTEKTEGNYISVKFGEKHLSGDNAVGTALLARRIHSK